jgi:hypothetical protein
LRLRFLRSLFVPNWKEVKRNLGRLYDVELNDPYSLHNVVRVIKSKKLDGRDVKHVWG